jgi:hypothetical protein
MFVAKSSKSKPVVVSEFVVKHGTHDQSSHNPKKGGGGAGGGSGKGATVGGVYLSDTVPIRGTVKLKDGSQIRGKITNNADRPTDIRVFEENPVTGKTSNISTRIPKVNVSRIDTGAPSIIDLTFPGGTFGD